jgi:hypothetical protein
MARLVVETRSRVISPELGYILGKLGCAPSPDPVPADTPFHLAPKFNLLMRQMDAARQEWGVDAVDVKDKDSRDAGQQPGDSA